MKFGVEKIAELGELLYEITPSGGKVKSVTTFKSVVGTIQFKYKKEKPAAPCAEEKRPEEKNQVEFDPNHALNMLAKALSDKLMAIKPENVEEMDSITTIGVGSIFFDFNINLRKAEKAKDEEALKRHLDEIPKDEEKSKSKKVKAKPLGLAE